MGGQENFRILVKQKNHQVASKDYIPQFDSIVQVYSVEQSNRVNVSTGTLVSNQLVLACKHATKGQPKTVEHKGKRYKCFPATEDMKIKYKEYDGLYGKYQYHFDNTNHIPDLDNHMRNAITQDYIMLFLQDPIPGKIPPIKPGIYSTKKDTKVFMVCFDQDQEIQETKKLVVKKPVVKKPEVKKPVVKKPVVKTLTPEARTCIRQCGEFLQHLMYTVPGNSGSPIFLQDGQDVILIGMNIGYHQLNGVGILYINDILDEIEKIIYQVSKYGINLSGSKPKNTIQLKKQKKVSVDLREIHQKGYLKHQKLEPQEEAIKNEITPPKRGKEHSQSIKKQPKKRKIQDRHQNKLNDSIIDQKNQSQQSQQRNQMQVKKQKSVPLLINLAQKITQREQVSINNNTLTLSKMPLKYNVYAFSPLKFKSLKMIAHLYLPMQKEQTLKMDIRIRAKGQNHDRSIVKPVQKTAFVGKFDGDLLQWIFFRQGDCIRVQTTKKYVNLQAQQATFEKITQISDLQLVIDMQSKIPTKKGHIQFIFERLQ